MAKKTRDTLGKVLQAVKKSIQSQSRAKGLRKPPNWEDLSDTFKKSWQAESDRLSKASGKIELDWTNAEIGDAVISFFKGEDVKPL